MIRSPLHVRPATERDLDQMAAMGAALAQMHRDFDTLRFLYEDDFEEGYRWWFSQELSRAEVFLGVIDGSSSLSGYVYGRIEGRDWNALLDEHAALIDLFVAPDARHHGMGAALLRAFCQWADERGAPRVVLSTATQNVAAQRLFASVGFRTTMIEMTRERGGDGG